MGNLTYWWSDAIDVTQASINMVASITAEQRETLHLENEMRLLHLNTVRSLVHLERTGTVSIDFYASFTSRQPRTRTMS